MKFIVQSFSERGYWSNHDGWVNTRDAATRYPDASRGLPQSIGDDAEYVDLDDPRSEVIERLEYLREEIEAERISYAEIDELQSMAEYIREDDTLLRQWAGIEEGE